MVCFATLGSAFLENENLTAFILSVSGSTATPTAANDLKREEVWAASTIYRASQVDMLLILSL